MAFGLGTINAFGGAVQDLMQGEATAKSLSLKAAGNRSEAENYGLAADLADQNAEFTRQSTAVKQYQADRALLLGQGQTQSDIAGAGFGNSGTALDLMRMNAQQGALTRSVLTQQGLITEAGYQEQSKAYSNMQKAALYAAQVQDEMADDARSNSQISAGFKVAAGIASIFI